MLFIPFKRDKSYSDIWLKVRGDIQSKRDRSIEIKADIQERWRGKQKWRGQFAYMLSEFL